MPLSLRALLARRELGLANLTPDLALDVPIGWVHVSELEDPTPFLDGGELLLTTGLLLPEGADALDALVSRLVATGVVGLGFGIGLRHGTTPAALRAVAAAHGLPLLEVPRATPFIAISKAVSEALAADAHARTLAVNEAHQRLTAAALRDDGFASLVRRLAALLAADAVLFDTTGAALHRAAGPGSSPAGLRRWARAVRPTVLATRADPGPVRVVSDPVAVPAGDASGELAIHRLHSPGTELGFLVARAPTFSGERLHILAIAADLVTLGLDHDRTLSATLQALRTTTFGLLHRVDAATARAQADALWGGLPAEPVVVACARGEAGTLQAVADALDAECRHGEPSPYRVEGGEVHWVLPSTPRSERRVAHLTEVLPGLRMGLSDPARYATLPAALVQARQALDGSRGRGAVCRFAALSGDGLLQAMDPVRTRAFAASLLAPLARADETGHLDLVRSLRVWLSRNGQWGPAADELGVHHHTLRNRVDRAAELLGLDLGSPTARAEVWLCLEALGAPGVTPANTYQSGRVPAPIPSRPVEDTL